MEPEVKPEPSIYQPLPIEARQTLHEQTKDLTVSSGQPSKEGGEFVINFVKTRTAADLDDVDTNLKRNFPLKNTRPTKNNNPRRQKKKRLTSTERRQLGLHKLPKKGLQFKSFTALHSLWLEYIENLLDLDKSTASGNQDQLLQRLAKADYHGCLLNVERSKCPSYIGVKGIVVMETKNTFQLICEDDQLRIIPKRGSIFCFVIRRWKFTVFGNQFNIRPIERASRKFKGQASIDL